ncbi:MAG: DUF4423 domain-containing protein [Bdellovibrio sp.]|nr:DUF4423 domain-containing protein [Bdellovibrio sp.]
MRSVFSGTPETPYRRRDLAKHLNCQLSFISQVFSGKSQISLEHAILIADLVQLDEDERRYFMTLVLLAKSGSKHLTDFYHQEALNLKNRAEIIKHSIKVKEELTLEDQAIYYSNWWYSAIHILSAFPEINSVSDFEIRLKLPRKVISEALTFLIERNLVTRTENVLGIGKTRIHLGSKSQLISRHHKNWREKSLDIISSKLNENLHYSAILGISKKGAEQLKETILSLIHSSEKIISETPEEVAQVLLIDFFRI